MFRIVLFLLTGLIICFLFLKSRAVESNSEKPIFLRVDSIANEHHTRINVVFRSMYRPTDDKLKTLKSDYSNLWAHLNYLYATNDVVAGKEYYTEGWFRQICSHYTGIQQPMLIRTDEQHELQIQNWSRDELVCTAIDSNIVFNYQYLDKTTKKTRATIALVLLFQGDHWRIDAMKVLSESLVMPTNN